LRELLDGTNIDKWDWNNNSTKRLATFGNQGALSNNSTKATPGLSADILGDWREEVIYRSEDSKQLMVFTTAIPTEHRLYTLMHDSQYRTAIAWQNSGYNQPPHPSFYLGEEMVEQEQPNIALVELEKKEQEIDFPEFPALTFDLAQVRPEAKATSGLRVDYTTDNPQVVIVENQQLKFVGVGTANVTATQKGNFAWEAADPVTKSLVVEKGIQTINFDDLPTLTVSDGPYLAKVESTSGLPVTLESKDPYLATVEGHHILVHEGGRTEIVAKQSGNELWLAADPVSKDLEILEKPSMDVVKVITPNGDGDNDVLIVREIERYPENTFRVFNRQGQLLFDMNNYNNVGRVFDGKDSSGNLLQEGTYFFKLEWVQDGKKLQQSGWFYLKR
jgi:gliding motility-associated-like protein